MRSITVTFETGETLNTNINGTNDEIRQYYVGRYFNLGGKLDPTQDRMVKATDVTFHPDTTICPQCGHAQLPPHNNANCSTCNKPLD